MLEANSELTWRDVQHVIANSSKIVDPSNLDWFKNEGGFMHNHNYGFGILNPAEAVRIAKNWITVPQYKSFTVTNSDVFPIPQGSLLVVPFDKLVSDITFIEHIESKTNFLFLFYFIFIFIFYFFIFIFYILFLFFIFFIKVLVKIDHKRTGELSITLTNEFSTMSMLALPHSDFGAFPASGWTYGSVRHWGEKVSQTWELYITDAKNNAITGNFLSAQITFYGHS